MTLVVAVALPDGTTWTGGDRYAGSFSYKTLAGPKVFHLERQGHHFAVGFAGTPRVAQTILAAGAPDRGDQPLESWLTAYCHHIVDHARAQGLTRDPGDEDPIYLAGRSGLTLATEGRVFLVDSEVGWEEPERGWVMQGGAFETFQGAYEVLRKIHGPIDGARMAWPVVQRFHNVGPLVDEIVLPAA